ncbi:hypothetical protein CRENBAI_001670 [Crenichthys baileyi]|uniref:Uncharacterized protein n=1 Tax=Crenichthys baileyi TaxID=28760 RepID=A0AAV9S2U7_9TELE
MDTLGEENVDSLQSHSDKYFHRVLKRKPQIPAAAIPTSKPTWSEYPTSTITSLDKSFRDNLDSVDQKLTGLDARLTLVEVLIKEFQALIELLEYSQEQMVTLATENMQKESVIKLTDDAFFQ